MFILLKCYLKFALNLKSLDIKFKKIFEIVKKLKCRQQNLKASPISNQPIRKCSFYGINANLARRLYTNVTTRRTQKAIATI